MDRLLRSYLAVVVVGFLVVSCADDYQDAQKPRLKDAPAIFVSASSPDVKEGATVNISVNVAAAPAGVDSVGVTALDADDEPFGVVAVETPINGQTSGEIIVTYTAPANSAGDVVVTIEVFDKQFDEKGEQIRKSSQPQEVDLVVFCLPALVGTYDVLGQFLVDDFGSPDVEGVDAVTSVDCLNDYMVSDLSGGLYTTTYAENYGTDPVEAAITVDPTSNAITWADVSDQFGGEVIQNPDTIGSNYNPSSQVMTIFWVATAFGETGVTTYTRQP